MVRVVTLTAIQARKKLELSQARADRGFLCRSVTWSCNYEERPTCLTARIRWYQYSPSSAFSETCNHRATEGRE